MKSVILTLLFLPIALFSQYKQYPRFDSDSVANQLILGNISQYCMDTVTFSISRVDKDSRPKNFTKFEVENKLVEIMSKGNAEFSGGTNRGYVFKISVLDKKDDTKFLYFIIFNIEYDSQKIYDIEVIKEQK